MHCRFRYLLLGLCFILPLLRPDLSHGATITMKAYDADGGSLSFAQFMDIVNCSELGLGSDSDMIVNLSDYTIISGWPMVNSGGNPAFDFTGSGVGLSIIWMTENTGYSTFFMDNEGGGFSDSATIIFNLQLALDYWRKLGNALDARPGYIRSAAFLEAYDEASSLLESAEAAGEDSEKGRLGQLALDRILTAQEIMLLEYGLQKGRQRVAAGEALWWGVTVDRRDGHAGVMDSISSLVDGSTTEGYARIVFDEWQPASGYDDIVAAAHDRGLHVVGEILDSFYMDEYSLAQFQERVREYVDRFPGIEVWEVGNEVGGAWLGSGVMEKVSYAAEYVKTADASDLTMLTLFWQYGAGDGPDCSLFNYARDNIGADLASNIDVIALSTYVTQCPMGASYDEIMTKLHERFPSQTIVIGELDYWIDGGWLAYWWRSTENPGTAVRTALMEQFYAAGLGYDFSMGGGFWWNYLTEMYPPNDLWESLHALYLSAHEPPPMEPGPETTLEPMEEPGEEPETEPGTEPAPEPEPEAAPDSTAEAADAVDEADASTDAAPDAHPDAAGDPAQDPAADPDPDDPDEGCGCSVVR
ncbi:MAG: hypothetical protein ABIJ56_00410 [Pseudomonadota bacterium]